MKHLSLCLLIFGLCLAQAQEQQRNSVTISAAGNFNPVSRVYINLQPDTAQQMLSSNRSAMGGSVEYQHWFAGGRAFGVEYEQNPSDGKLVFQPVPPIGESIWREMRYEALAIFRQEVPVSASVSIFTQVGAGVNMTNGYSNSGWSHDPAFAEGAGTDYRLSQHTSIEVSTLWLETETGCYNGRACKQTWGVVTDTRVGLKVGW